MYIQSTETGDGTARMTISLDGRDHRFEVWAEENTAYVSYEETLGNRGQIEVVEPSAEVFTHLMSSDEMAAFLDRHDCASVKRGRDEP